MAVVGRYDVLNNEGKTINLFRQYASNLRTPIRWVVGHGLLTGKFPKVPARTYIIFMADPGYALNSKILANMGRAYNNITYVRNVFSGKQKNIQPTRFRYWKEHVYGPNDLYPDLKLRLTNKPLPYSEESIAIAKQLGYELPPLENSKIDKMFGVKNLKTKTITFYGHESTLKEVVERSGPGIYLVIACRPSQRHSNSSEHRETLKQHNTVKVRHMPPVSHRFPLNAAAQQVEKNQARVAARKRARSSPARAPVRTYANVAAGRSPARTYANVVAGRKRNRPASGSSPKRVNIGVRSNAKVVLGKPRTNSPKNTREANLTKQIAAKEQQLRNTKQFNINLNLYNSLFS